MNYAAYDIARRPANASAYSIRLLAAPYINIAASSTLSDANTFLTMSGSAPIIGVAKNRYLDTQPESELLRGESQKPLFVTAVGVDLVVAKEQIGEMDGIYRIPTLLKQVDSLCRQRG